MRPAIALHKAISSAEFLNVLQRLDLPPLQKYAVAVSGGADSMALACLLYRYAPQRVHAITVNHNLRPESGAEVLQVRDTLTKLSIPCSILEISWNENTKAQVIRNNIEGGGTRSGSMNGESSNNGEGKPTLAQLEERARNQRYIRLADFCLEHDISKLFVAHHLNDQIETVFFRLSRASGVFGLAGILEAADIPVQLHPRHKDITVLRPLLHFPKSRILDTCKELGVPWIEDPSNADSRYQRNAIRTTLGSIEKQGGSTAEALSTSSLKLFCEHTKTYADEGRVQTAKLYERYVLHDPLTGTAFLHLDVTASNSQFHWFLTRPHLAYHVIAEIVRWISCLEHAPRLQTVMRVYQKMRQEILTSYQSPIIPTLCIDGAVVLSPRTIRNGRYNWIFAAAPPLRGHRPLSAVKLTNYHQIALFEARYFITALPSSIDLTNPLMHSQMESFHKSTRQHLPHGLTAESCGLMTNHISSQLDNKVNPTAPYELVVRYFSKNDMEALSLLIRKQRHHHKAWTAYRRAYQHYMEKMPVVTRFTVPVIAVRDVQSKYVTGDNSEEPDVVDAIVAIPCMGINLCPEIFTIDMTFRGVPFHQRQSKMLP